MSTFHTLRIFPFAVAIFLDVFGDIPSDDVVFSVLMLIVGAYTDVLSGDGIVGGAQY